MSTCYISASSDDGRPEVVHEGPYNGVCQACSTLHAQLRAEVSGEPETVAHVAYFGEDGMELYSSDVTSAGMTEALALDAIGSMIFPFRPEVRRAVLTMSTGRTVTQHNGIS